jgi:NADH-quinone oxidoreductase subunit L
MLPQLLPFFIYLPLAGFVCSLLVPHKKEKLVSGISITTIGIQLLAIVALIISWILNDAAVLDLKHMVLFTSPGFQIFIDLYFDRITAVYAITGAVLTLLVAIFSRFYLHREAGFKRFFGTLLLFYSGYNLVIFAGNFETLFIGWEFLGIASFLLIAFYRDRWLPVKNSLKVISIYRFSDICLLLAMWMSHHLWHENITFFKLNDALLVANQVQGHYGFAVFIAIMLLLAAAIKSAQLPFSSWLPRAMEGPTTSSAIFYGSLSVHIGVFLLMRTYPFWESIPAIKIAVIMIGLATAFIAAGIARVQPTVKTQIAYASIVQIGIMFVEVALGWHVLALIHFMGNAFLRTYQLLVSPSVLSYLTHDQFYHFDPTKAIPKAPAFPKLRNTLYMLSIKEWNLDSLLMRFLWTPFKWLGKKLRFLTHIITIAIVVVIYLLGYFFFAGKFDTGLWRDSLSPVLAFIGLLLVLRSFTERADARKPWLLVFAAQVFIVASIVLNDQVELREIIIYLTGGIVSVLVGYFCLNKIKRIDNDISLNHFHGYTYEQPWIAFVFLLSCLGLLGFPITPSFIGVDLLFTHIHEDQPALLVFTSLSFAFIELSLLRIYARIFMGQHKKPYHAIAFKSS